MQQYFTSGLVADAILALMAIELAVLLAIRWMSGSGPQPMQIISNLAAGAALVLALRSALTGAPWVSTGIWLFTALLAHASELYAQRRK